MPMLIADPYSAFLSLIFSLINAAVILEESLSADTFSQCGIYSYFLTSAFIYLSIITVPQKQTLHSVVM